jgi:DNA mismatch repair protein MSH2
MNWRILEVRNFVSKRHMHRLMAMFLIPTFVMTEAETTLPTKFSKTEMEEGAKLVEEVLRSWSSTVNNAVTAPEGDEDEVMGDGSADDDARELQRLKACFERFRPQIEANPWCQEILASL